MNIGRGSCNVGNFRAKSYCFTTPAIQLPNGWCCWTAAMISEEGMCQSHGDLFAAGRPLANLLATKPRSRFCLGRTVQWSCCHEALTTCRDKFSRACTTNCPYEKPCTRSAVKKQADHQDSSNTPQDRKPQVYSETDMC